MSKTTRAAVAPFVLDTDSTFRWPVHVRVPDPTNPGGKLKTRFVAEFKHVDQARRLELLREHREAIAETRDGDQDEQIEGLFSLSQRVLEEVLVGFVGVVDRGGNEVAFSPDAKRTLISHQMVWPAIYAAYNEAISQQDRRGN